MDAPGAWLFDVDGTLVHVGGAGRRSLAAAFGETFGVADAAEVLRPIRFDGNTDAGILREAAERAGLSATGFAAGRRRLEAAYLRALREALAADPGPGVLPGVRLLLERLRGRGDALGLLTGNLESGARAKLEPFGLNAYFPTGAFGAEHDDRRVLAGLARERVEAACGRRFRPDRVHVVGDSAADVRSGKAHGFRTVAVLTGWTSRAELEAEAPDFLLTDLTELPALLWPPGTGAS